MADEPQPTAGATPASAPTAKPAAKETVVEQLRKALKPSKKEREAEIKNKAEARGANEVLKAAGVKKSERARVLEELKAGKLKLAGAEQESAEAKTKAAAALTDAETVKAENAVLKAQAAERDALLKGWADEQFNALPESLQKFIAATAGDSLDSRLKAIKTAKESGLFTTQEAAAATAQVKTEEKPSKPATTSTAANPKAPPPSTNQSPKQVWQQMRNPAADETHAQRIARERLAAAFYLQHQNAIDADF